MKKYKYYYRSDSNKETVGIVEAMSMVNAVDKAAAKKNLGVLEFSSLFNVEEIDGRQN